MSSVYVVCWIILQTFQTYFYIQANSVDPDQTAPRGEEQSDLGPHRLQKWLLKSQADDKADDNGCDYCVWSVKEQPLCRLRTSQDQISPQFCTFWSRPCLLVGYIQQNILIRYEAGNDGQDQTVHMHELIWASFARTRHRALSVPIRPVKALTAVGC